MSEEEESAMDREIRKFKIERQRSAVTSAIVGPVVTMAVLAWLSMIYIRGH